MLRSDVPAAIGACLAGMGCLSSSLWPLMRRLLRGSGGRARRRRAGCKVGNPFCYAWDVNIFIWTSRKSVGHGTNDRVMVHGDGTRADGRRSGYGAQMNEIMGARDRRGASWKRDRSFNVVVIQAGYLARPRTKVPETQIYFITHGSGAFPVPRVRTVVHGERASRSIVNRTTALWSIWMVESLILSGPTYLPVFG